VDPDAADRINGAAEHRELALRAARESIVLLKNDGNTLPLSPGIRKIAVIGTDATEARMGGYSGKGNRVVSILDGIRELLPTGTEILYSPGCSRSEKPFVPVPPAAFTHDSAGLIKPGLRAEYFDNISLSGQPVLTRTEPTLQGDCTLFGPGADIPLGWFSARWTGRLNPGFTGNLKIGLEGDDGYRLWLGDSLLIDNWVKASAGCRLADFATIEGKDYSLRLEFFESSGPAKLRLVWDRGITDSLEDVLQYAAYLAEQADVSIVTAGIEEGEFRDRSSLSLPGHQEELIRAVASAGKPLVVVLIGGSAITMNNWIGQVPAIIDAWYPGEAGGRAVAEVLFGQYNPAGRLPVTFPLSVGQLPLVYNHKPTGRGDDYLDLSGKPLFPFGHGLS